MDSDSVMWAEKSIQVAKDVDAGIVEPRGIGSLTFIMTEYGHALLTLDRIIGALNRGFGEAMCTEDRVLRMIRNNIPMDLRPLFSDLPQ